MLYDIGATDMIQIPEYIISKSTTETGQYIAYPAISRKGKIKYDIILIKKNILTPSYEKRLQEEYTKLGDSGFENIIKPSEIINLCEGTAVITEKSNAVSLDEYISTNKIKINSCLNIILNLAETIGILHRNNILHKNINPQNILIHPQNETIMLTNLCTPPCLQTLYYKVYNKWSTEKILPYISPEQTGMTNRQMDHRSELYSLGTIFYRILTGIILFQSDNSFEILNSHFTKRPIPPCEINPDIPKAVSDIALKLLKKSPENRYQSAFSLYNEIEKCISFLHTTGEIPYFIPGENDIPQKLIISKKLYGRNQNIDIFRKVFENVRDGNSEIINVTGPSGIGKTTLILNVLYPVIKNKGYYITGKCDQLHRDIPYYPLLLAFQSLVKQILAESNNGIEIWKESILEAVGNNGQILIDVIPDIELIIGSQQECPQLESEESKNRFNMVFNNFVRIFTTSNHPLILFIDDLQWVDSATLMLLKNLITDPEIKSFFLISAYRDNEISKYHNLTTMNTDLRLMGVSINDIHLSPLDLDDISHLIVDTLKCTSERSLSLSKLAMEYTKGNPLSVNQFLNLLYDENILTFSIDSGWTWNISKIKAFYETDNFISLMGSRIKMLPDNERNILEIASCIGNTFDIKTLSQIINLQENEIITDLNKIADTGFISASGNMYKFTHDRIYETVYSLIPKKEKIKNHKRIGEVLLVNSNEKNIHENIFSIVNQLNNGYEQFANENENIKLTELNFKAGMKAMHSIAYESAVKYFTFGLKLLQMDSWEKYYDLTKMITLKNFECQYLLDNLKEAHILFQDIIKNSKTNLEKAELHNLNVTLLMNSGKPGMAIIMGIEGLKLLGVKIHQNPGKHELIKEKIKLKRKLFKQSINKIVTLSEMTDKNKISVMSLLMNLWMPAYSINHNLMHLISMKMVNTSLKYGNCNISSFGYISYSMVMGASEGNFKRGHELGTIALKLNNIFKNNDIRCQLNFMFGAFLAHWRNNAETDIKYLKEAYNFGSESGNVYYSRLTCIFHAGTMFIKGDNLNSVYKTALKYLDYTEKGKTIHISNALTAVIRIILQLQGKIKNTLSLSDDTFDENQFFIYLKDREVIQPFHWYCIFKARNLFIFEHYEEANKIINIDETIIDWHFSSITLPEHYFIKSLILAAIYKKSSIKVKNKILKKISSLQKVLKHWADNSPENFMHKYYLVEAEKCRLMSENFRAMEFYKRSIESAKKNSYIQNEAIANELAAKFYVENNFDDFAKKYFCSARKAYHKWGALQKVRIMEDKYPQYLTEPLENNSEAAGKTQNKKTDESLGINLTQILQVLSNKKNQIDLEVSITKFACDITLADKAMLLLNKNKSLKICTYVDHEMGDDIRILTEAATLTARLPESIINYVFNSYNYVVIHNPAADERFSNDPYFDLFQPEKILCFPLIQKGICDGIIFLEKNNSKSDFTHEQLEMLKIAANHSTILLGNMSHSRIKKIQKYDHSLLKGLDTELINNKLKDLMETKKVFMTEDLTLLMISEELSISPQQLSEFLNNKLSVNFNTYINQYRIIEARKLLTDDPEKPVISIAYEIGFNSVSVFYNAFMKFNGMSPAKYRKQQLCPNSDTKSSNTCDNSGI